MPIEVTTVTLPSYWASALVNGDQSGMTTNEVVAMNVALRNLQKDGWYIVSTVDGAEPRFTNSYQLYDITATWTGGEVLDYVAHRRRITEAPISLAALIEKYRSK